MITIRGLKQSDFYAVKKMHVGQGFDYQLPSLTSGEWMLKAVLEDQKGPEMAVLLRRTAEAYFLVGDAGSKRERLGKMLALQQDLTKVARLRAIPEVHCFVPPAIAENFGGLLMHVGWNRPLWPCYSKEL